MMIRALVFSFFLVPSASVWAVGIQGTDASSPAPEAKTKDFSKMAFSQKQCTEKIPIPRGRNPWLRIAKRKGKSAGMGMDPMSPSTVESYYITPANKSKRVAVINQEDNVYDSTTNLERIDCKNGLIYFQKTVREPVQTSFYRVFDLFTGEEYAVTEGAVTVAPNGKFLLSVSVSDRDQKCGRTGSCDISMKLFTCSGRKSNKTACKLQTENNYSMSSKEPERNAVFSALPVRWNWNKAKEDLRLTVGGTSKSKSQIRCKVLPKYKCSVANAGPFEFTIKQ